MESKRPGPPGTSPGGSGYGNRPCESVKNMVPIKVQKVNLLYYGGILMMLRHAQGCSGMLTDGQGCSGMVRDGQECSGMLRGAHGCSEMLRERGRENKGDTKKGQRRKKTQEERREETQQKAILML